MSSFNQDIEKIREVFEKALELVTKDNYLDEILKAKEVYFSQTGKIDDDDDDFESRMIDFNEWYLLQYTRSGPEKNLLEEVSSELSEYSEIVNTLTQVRHTVLEYRGLSFLGRPIFLDFLLNKKIKLLKDTPLPPIVKGDIFTSRIIPWDKDFNILGAVSILPKDARKVIAKEAKRVRKQKSKTEEYQFLMKLEALKTKWKQYGHVGVTQIFRFK